MRNEISLAKAVGKTLEGSAFSVINNQMVLTFSDETFVTLGVGDDYGGGAEIKEESLILLEFGQDSLVNLGIITQEEIDEAINKRQKEYEARRLQTARIQYERLKKEFENNEGTSC